MPKRSVTRRIGCLEDLAGLALVGADGFLHQHVLATRDACERLVVVQGVGAADVDGVDLGACGKRLKGGEGQVPTVLGGVGGRAFFVA